MFGCIPGHRKSEYHRMAPSLKKFAEVLVDIFTVVKPSLAIMDGIVGMEGNGPSAGKPRKIGLVLASSDCVAIDSIASRIIGLDPFKIHSTAVAHARSLGQGDWELIEVAGERLTDLIIKDYDLPSNAMMEIMPGFMIKGLLDTLRARPEINQSTCAGCSFCIESCPVQAMSMSGKIPVIDFQKCISCLCCQELCPKSAVELKPASRIGKALLSIVRHGRKHKK
jgi:ferredoxin